MLVATIFSALVLFLISTTAQAYIGPGAGAGAIVVVLGILASILLAFVAILWYPFKRLLKKRQAKNKPTKKEKNPSKHESDKE